jgi:hypothetical protein
MVRGSYPSRVTLIVKSPAVAMDIVQGVRQLFPNDDRAPAPGGSDCISSVVVVGFGLRTLKLGRLDELQAASPRPQITKAKI